MAITVKPITQHIGADIEGVDLTRPLTPEEVAQIQKAWNDHLVLRFRNQNMTDDDLVRFSGYYGELDQAPIHSEKKRADDDRVMYINIISNVVENGVALGSLGDGESKWHTDMSYNEDPPKASLLYAVELPDSGGDTQFCNMYRAYELLPQSVKDRIKDLKAVHDASTNSVGQTRRGFDPIKDPTEAVGAVHPLVVLHPETNRPALYLGRRLNGYIKGLSLEESEALLDELWSYAAQEDNVMTQVWKMGDMIMWDNRCTMHRRDSIPQGARRTLHRTQLGGKPMAAAFAA